MTDRAVCGGCRFSVDRRHTVLRVRHSSCEGSPYGGVADACGVRIDDHGACAESQRNLQAPPAAGLAEVDDSGQ